MNIGFQQFITNYKLAYEGSTCTSGTEAELVILSIIMLQDDTCIYMKLLPKGNSFERLIARFDRVQKDSKGYINAGIV